MTLPPLAFRLLLLGVGAVASAALLVSCNHNDTKEIWPPGSPRVLTSFPPLYCFVRNVAGDDASVLCLCTTQGPHDYSYSAHDALTVKRAGLFLTNGLNLDDHFTTRLRDSCGNPGLRMVEVAQAIPADRLRKYDPDSTEHRHGVYDPHVWLGLPEAVLMVKRVRDELKKANPAKASEYDQRAAAYLARLEDLHQYGQAAFRDKKEKDLISFHESLAYFARGFGLRIINHVAPRPGVEPDQHRLAELVKACRANGVRVITWEPQYQEGTARTLVDELRLKGVADAVIVPVDPLETADAAELSDPAWYERKMRENIDNLAKVLR
jgi:ABC-type Zn uptake system ZnuABC Zn-binding protein ZnuA